MPIKLIRLMDAYGARVMDSESKGVGIDSRRLQEVRDAARRLVSDIQKVLKDREKEEPKEKK